MNRRLKLICRCFLFLTISGLICGVGGAQDKPILPADWPLYFESTGVPLLNSEYGPRLRSQDGYDFHGGVDFVGNSFAYPGDDVYSVSDGWIIAFNDQADLGSAVIIYHYIQGYSEEYRGIYAHLANPEWYNQLNDEVESGFTCLAPTYALAGGAQLHYASSLYPQDAFGIEPPNWHPACTLPIDDQACSELLNVNPTTSSGYITSIQFTAKTDADEGDLEGLMIYIWYDEFSSIHSYIQYSYSWYEVYGSGIDAFGYEEFCQEINTYLDQEPYQTYIDHNILEDWPSINDVVTVRTSPRDMERSINSSTGLPNPADHYIDFTVTFPSYYVEEGYVGIELIDANADLPCSDDPSIMRWGNLDGGPSIVVSDFSVEALNDSVAIKWTGADARSVEGIHLLRSTDSLEGYTRITDNPLPCGPKQFSYTDTPDQSTSTLLYYKYEIVYNSGSSVTSKEYFSVQVLPIPYKMTLKQNYPNPFNPETKIIFLLSPQDAGKIELNVYNLTGQLVKKLIDRDLSAGEHEVTWDGTDADGRKVGSGIYFYRLSTNSGSDQRKMLLLK